MRNERKDFKYWLSVILMLVTIVGLFTRIESRLTRIEEKLCSNKDLSTSTSNHLEKRIVMLEEEIRNLNRPR